MKINKSKILYYARACILIIYITCFTNIILFLVNFSYCECYMKFGGTFSFAIGTPLYTINSLFVSPIRVYVQLCVFLNVFGGRGGGIIVVEWNMEWIYGYADDDSNNNNTRRIFVSVRLYVHYKLHVDTY